jgi:hypothetical protein
MEFNVKKCKVMHLGFNNPGHTYSMNNQQLATTEDERDIGVCVSKNLNPSALHSVLRQQEQPRQSCRN